MTLKKKKTKHIVIPSFFPAGNLWFLQVTAFDTHRMAMDYFWDNLGDESA